MNLLEYLKIYKEQKGIAQRTLKDKRSKLQAKNKQVENREISVINEKIAKLEAQLEELKTIYKSKDSKKTKWAKVKPIMIWLADKSVDVGIAFLPLITSMFGG